MQSHHADDLYTSISFMKKPVTKKNGKRRHCDIMYLQKSLTKSVAAPWHGAILLQGSGRQSF
jgi:hypothetical protein